jgi:hypothetical protein
MSPSNLVEKFYSLLATVELSMDYIIVKNPDEALKILEENLNPTYNQNIPKKEISNFLKLREYFLEEAKSYISNFKGNDKKIKGIFKFDNFTLHFMNLIHFLCRHKDAKAIYQELQKRDKNYYVSEFSNIIEYLERLENERIITIFSDKNYYSFWNEYILFLNSEEKKLLEHKFELATDVKKVIAEHLQNKDVSKKINHRGLIKDLAYKAIDIAKEEKVYPTTSIILLLSYF